MPERTRCILLDPDSFAVSQSVGQVSTDALGLNLESVE